MKASWLVVHFYELQQSANIFAKFVLKYLRFCSHLLWTSTTLCCANIVVKFAPNIWDFVPTCRESQLVFSTCRIASLLTWGWIICLMFYIFKNVFHQKHCFSQKCDSGKWASIDASFAQSFTFSNKIVNFSTSLCLPAHLLAHLLRLGNDGPPAGLGEGAEEEVAGGARQQLLHQCAAFAPPWLQNLKFDFFLSKYFQIFTKISKFYLGASSFSLTTSSMASWAKRTTKERRATLMIPKNYGWFPVNWNIVKYDSLCLCLCLLKYCKRSVHLTPNRETSLSSCRRKEGKWTRNRLQRKGWLDFWMRYRHKYEYNKIIQTQIWIPKIIQIHIMDEIEIWI